MQNINMRIFVSESGVHYKEIAKEIGITPEHLSFLMKEPLSSDYEEKIKNAVAVIMARKKSEVSHGETSV